ncbi:hypothetical protein [Shewanella salipaludis]|uniref:Orphan protein n=1 Tax=Shewanella salipaludis TaxID=2723052 RepID=A0A972JJH1_9GAMM|nr:hypothetical protein [Shewanella salipaludis]NMH64044.1 hypothetical protein [Shewanella salipaludis]
MEAGSQHNLNQKLTLLCRLEPGCLGPDGAQHIEAFCTLAQQALQSYRADIAIWQLTPRYDKRLSEMSYRLGDRPLTPAQSDKYLALFNLSLDEFEEKFQDKLTGLITQFLARHSRN